MSFDLADVACPDCACWPCVCESSPEDYSRSGCAARLVRGHVCGLSTSILRTVVALCPYCDAPSGRDFMRFALAKEGETKT